MKGYEWFIFVKEGIDGYSFWDATSTKDEAIKSIRAKIDDEGKEAHDFIIVEGKQIHVKLHTDRKQKQDEIWV